MATKLRPIGHEDRLSLVDHLDELRTRIIISVIAFAVAFGFCAWQSNHILKILNRPLEESTHASSNGKNKNPLEQDAIFTAKLKKALQVGAATNLQLARTAENLSASERRLLIAQAQAQLAAARAAPAATKRRPVTLGVTEPFTTTFKVAGYAALLISLPLLLYELYAFVVPAFTPQERRAALPLMLMVPGLFITGVVFGYYVVLPPAVNFLQNFNDQSFDILVQAREYYGFAILVMALMGLVFQMPVGILGLTRLGVVTPRQLRKNRRYAILVLAIVAAVATPSPDPVTMLLALGPLLALFEGSILLASLADRRREKREAEEPELDDPDELDDYDTHED